MTSETKICPCGSQHPIGVLCEKSASPFEARGHESSCGCAHDQEHARVTNDHSPSESHSHDHTHTHSHEHGCTHDHGTCNGHEHVGPEPVDFAAVGEASDTRAVYRIMNMDCPMEEALIRKRLGGVPGIVKLEFNLMQRLLTVDHELATTDSIVAALKSIDMTPEPLGMSQSAVALFSINGMDCPIEENLIKAKLNGMLGVLGLEFNLMQRTLKVRHEPSALPAISEALMTLNMDAKLMDMEAGETNVVPDTKIPWVKLAFAGAFAAL